MSSQPATDSLASTLGHVPSGVFILVAGDGQARKTGLLASWVQQAAFAPPQVTVAVNKSRYLNEWLKPGSPVTLNQIRRGDNQLFKHFGKGFEPDADAFEGLETESGENGLPLLKAAMASMEGTIVSQMEAADHVIYLVQLTGATAHQDVSEFEPLVHIRRNGLNY